MNYFICMKIIGLLLVTFGVSMLPALGWSVALGDGATGALSLSMLLTLAAGGAFYALGRLRKEEIFRKEATFVVGLGWIFSAGAGALPYYFSGIEAWSAFSACYFEAMSGLTTTGATVLGDIESVPAGLLFWRSWTHWLGGLGIIMLFVAVLPYLGAGGRALVRSEVTGPVKDGLTPRIKDTAQLLWRLYIGLTIAETVLLMIFGMSFFDALCHAFGTMATGGFSTKNASVAHFDSTGTEFVIILFMLAAGMNFSLLWKAFTGKSLRPLFEDSEWRLYIGFVALGALLIAWALVREGTHENPFTAGRHAAFTVTSIITTTGFVTADFESWPALAKTMLAFFMFVGGCAGSTGGGFKVIRWLILFKIARATLARVYQPRLIDKIKVGGNVVDDAMQTSVLGLFVLWIFAFIGGGMMIALIEGPRIDFISALAASAATLNSIGPGFGQVGAVENFAFFRPASKWILSLLMVLGRLELYSILVLFIPGFWRTR